MADIPPQSEGMKMLDPVGRLFAASWRLYKERFLVLFSILALPMAIIGIGELAATQRSSYAALIGAILVLGGCIFFLIAVVASIFSVIKGVGVADSYRGGLKFFWPMFWIGILVILALIGGLLVFIIPCYIISTWVLFSQYILITEDKHGMGAISASREYVRGYWWEVFGRYLLVSFLSGLGLAIVQLIATALFGKTVGTIVYVLLWLIVWPFLYVFLYELYKNLTVLKPSLATEKQTSSRGLFITFDIIGLLAMVLIPIIVSFVLVKFVANGIIKVNPNGGYQIATSTSGTPLPYSGPAAVTAPAAGATLAQGSQYVIEWQPTNSSTVSINLLQNGNFLFALVTRELDTGAYSWIVPSQYSGAGFEIYVTQAGQLPITSGQFNISTSTAP